MNHLLPSIQKIIDVSLEYNIAPDKKFHYNWYEHGNWQMDILKKMGLAPSHKLLDVGCGCLRLGLLAIDYLDDGNYHGIDGFEPYLDIGRRLLKEAGFTKKCHLVCHEDFNFDAFGEKFDFAMAQSVFTHLPLAQVKLCLKNLTRVMKKGGQFITTFIHYKTPNGFFYMGVKPMITGAHLSPEFLAGVAGELGIEFKMLEANHFSQQQVGCYTF